MALIVIDMGRRVVTPQPKDRRRSIKVQPSKNSSAIDQFNQFLPDHQSSPSPQTSSAQNSQEDLQNNHIAHENHSKNNDPYRAQQQSQKEPSQVSLLADIMSTQVATLSPTANVADAWQLFQRHGFHHIPITDENNTVLAMLSDRDILQGPGKQDNINLENIMRFATAQVFCFSADTDIRQATRTLYEYDLGALPIISEEHELLGIVTRTDIIKTVSHYGPLELWA